MGKRNGTRQLILDAAAEAFMKSGYDGASIDDIADEIDRTKGIIYYHFRSKTDLFQEVYEHGLRELSTGVTAAMQAFEGSGSDRLRMMAEQHLRHLMAHHAYHDVVRQGLDQRLQDSLTEAQRSRFQALERLRREYEHSFASVIAEGVEDGSVRADHPQVTARIMVASLNATTFWLRHYNPRDYAMTDEQFAAYFIDLFLNGVAVPLPVSP